MALHLASRSVLAARALPHLPNRVAVGARLPAPAVSALHHRRPLALVVRASAEDEEGAPKKEKKPKKKIASPVKRAMLAEERRRYNKSRKSCCATRIKKVIIFSNSKTAPTAEATADDMVTVEKLVNEAYRDIDKAVTRGILHQNTADRRKKRVAKYKRMVAMAAGLFTPTPEHPDYKKFLRMKEVAARKKQAAPAQQ
ncbi:hypothetical protein DUNSADRAFT_17120 [Dunaliella salina]|uniref:30S ribosomal protein S20, chloroplastic n=1 Tax=Dunaliella salina TaxID=3046 RepID=A0ABQ7G2C9_DUNSA|nr:hypothetical protein DUNSADRAFT_17120 [Dunaliella salina]|eukprot:KAF5828758.1 hypothetical protein DUNSADRAFT_17120 [Dunaliella salina]